MAPKKFEAGQIIGHLRTIEVFLGRGKTAGEACREVGITEQTYYRWRKEIWWHAGIAGPSSEGAGEREQPLEEGGS